MPPYDDTGEFFTEADTRAKLIDPALYQQGWTEAHIRREQTAGTIELTEDGAERLAPGRIDYVLRLPVSEGTQPFAVAYVEAKRENALPEAGIDQAQNYQKRLHVAFVYSTNGKQFIEYDAHLELTSPPRPMEEFPTPAELRERYEQIKGFKLSSTKAKALLMPYARGEATRRYYQDAAIRAVLEKIAARKPMWNRALLSLATGAGKTFIAVNLLKKIADAGQLQRALFLCDRDELRTQALGAFAAEFGADAAEVYADSAGKNHARNARVHIATYQTLDVAGIDATANFLLTHYPENHFSHVVIDECHRSAWGKWSAVLKRFASAVQIGLTATPREVILSAAKLEESTFAVGAFIPWEDRQLLADNHRYFGDPVYEYTLMQGIEDGYLAPPDIHTFDLYHDNHQHAERVRRITGADLKGKTVTDSATGQVVSEEQKDYGPAELEKRLLMPERIDAMCGHLFAQLLAHGGPEQKTIVFCVTDWHAAEVARRLRDLYRDWCQARGVEPKQDYAFRCTQKAGDAKSTTADLRGSVTSHFIACTVELLSTGVDVPALQNIAFFKYLSSPILFAQMLGRGTRLHAETEKLMFRVFDYTGATDLFGLAYKTKLKKKPAPGGGKNGPTPLPPKKVEGVTIRIDTTGRYLIAVIDGEPRKVSVEEYRQRLAARLLHFAPDLAAFRTRWLVPDQRHELLAGIVQSGLSPKALAEIEELQACDLFDVLGEVGYALQRRTRAERAFMFHTKNAKWLAPLPLPAQATLKAVANQFGKGGTEALESASIWDAPEVFKAGGLPALKKLGKPADIIDETKERLFAA